MFNDKYPELHACCRKLIARHDPEFVYDCIQINKSYQMTWHVDRNNRSESIILGLGDYTGGELLVKGEDGQVDSIDIRNRLVKFNGRMLHCNAPFTGTRYSLVFFRLRKHT